MEDRPFTGCGTGAASLSPSRLGLNGAASERAGGGSGSYRPQRPLRASRPAPRRVRRPDLTMARGGRGRPRSAGPGEPARREGTRARPAAGSPAPKPGPAASDPGRGWRPGTGVVRWQPAPREAARAPPPPRGGLHPRSPAQSAPSHASPPRPLSPAVAVTGSSVPGPNTPRPGKTSSGVRAAPRPLLSSPLAAYRNPLECPRPRSCHPGALAPFGRPRNLSHAGLVHGRPSSPLPRTLRQCRKAAPRTVATPLCVR